MEFRKNVPMFFRTILGWFLIVQGGLWGISGGICAIVALFGGMKFNSFEDRLLFFTISLVMTVGCLTILRLGLRLKNSGHKEKTASPVKRKSSPAKQKEASLPEKVKQESDKAKEQEFAAKRAEIKIIYRDFIEGDGRLPEGFSEKYNTTTKSGYILHETPFKEYLDEIMITIDALHNHTGISDWIYFDGQVEINTAIEMLIVWVRRHREMNMYLRKNKVGIGFWFLGQDIYCEHKIMVVMENGDAFWNATEKSIASCKAEGISFCTILSKCELYDLIENKAKIIEYTIYPGYHDETYADWWLTERETNGKL